VYDDEEEQSGWRKSAAGRNAGRDSGRRPVAGGARGRNEKKKQKDNMPHKWKALLVVAAIAVAILISIPLSEVAASLLSARSVTVPDVLGMEEETAAETLEADGFKYDIDYVSELPKTADGFAVVEEYEPGQVVKQDPAGDSKAKKGSTVYMTVLEAVAAAPKDEDKEKEKETEEAPVEKAVPNVVGKARADAETAITAAGFAVGDTSSRNSDSPVGTVIEQTPKSGEMLQTGKKVNIVLSSGPKAKTTTVPEIVGTSVEAAKGILAGTNLEMGMITYDYSPEFSAGAIMSQSPAQGTVLEEWKAVSVVVCLGAGPTVPPFSGMDLDNYMALLNSWGLVGNPQAEYSNTVPAGTIVRVDPASYAAVTVGSTVNVYVSLGPQTPAPGDGTDVAGGPAAGGTP
jgi:serine/threonine-protein kinase